MTARQLPPIGTDLPEGVRLLPQTAHADSRGTLREIFRRTWIPELALLQWNVVQSEAGTLRGVHVHPHHDDYLVAITGETMVGLRDLRRHSPTFGRGAMFALGSAALLIPHGVAHGFLHVTTSTHLYGVTHYWDMADELACRWNDPELNLPWPISTPRLSPRDQAAPDLAALMSQAGDRL